MSPVYSILHRTCSVLRFLVNFVHTLVAKRHGICKRFIRTEGDDFRTSKVSPEVGERPHNCNIPMYDLFDYLALY